MRTTWMLVALGAAALMVGSCGGRATLGGSVPGGEGDRGTDAAPGWADGPGAWTDGGTSDDAGKPPGLVITVTAVSPSPELAESPAVGATVALDTPTGERIEATADADGRAIFAPVTWATEAVTVTAGLPGYALRTELGISGADGEVAVKLRSLAEPTDLVSVTASLVSPPPTWPYWGGGLTVSATIPHFNYASPEGPLSFVLEAPPGIPFSVIGLWIAYKSCGTGCIRPFMSEWVVHDLPALTSATTVDLDFTYAVAGRSAEGTLHLPGRPESPLRGGLCGGNVSTFASNGYAQIGQVGSVELAPDVSRCDYAVSYVEHPVIVTPVTRAGVWSQDAVSLVWATGYPHEMPEEIVLIDAPQWRSGPGQSLQSPLAWQHFDDGVSSRVALTRSDGKTVWWIDTPAGVTSVVVPAPPSTVDTTALLGQQELTARITLTREEGAALTYFSSGEAHAVTP